MSGVSLSAIARMFDAEGRHGWAATLREAEARLTQEAQTLFMPVGPDTTLRVSIAGPLTDDTKRIAREVMTLFMDTLLAPPVSGKGDAHE